MRRELLERGFESSRKMIFAHMDARSNFLERELACQSRINIVPNQLELASTHPSPAPSERGMEMRSVCEPHANRVAHQRMVSRQSPNQFCLLSVSRQGGESSQLEGYVSSSSAETTVP